MNKAKETAIEAAKNAGFDTDAVYYALDTESSAAACFVAFPGIVVYTDEPTCLVSVQQKDTRFVRMNEPNQFTASQIGAFINDLLDDHMEHTPEDLPMIAIEGGPTAETYTTLSPITVGGDRSNMLLTLPNGQQFKIMVLAR